MERRLLPLVATVVALLGCALAADSSVMPTSVVSHSHNPSVLPSSSSDHHPSVSPSPSHSSASPSPSHSSASPSPSSHTHPSSSPSPSPSPSTSTPLVPIPSPTPDTPFFPDESYMVYRNESVCVHLVASIETAVMYISDSGVNTTLFMVSRDATVNNDSSWCNDSSAALVLSWKYSGQDIYNLTFLFINSGVTWTEGGVTFEYGFNHDLFPGHDGGGFHGYAEFGNLLENQASNIEQQRSFLCNETQTLSSNDTNTNYTTNATMTVKNLRMQAFYFRNPKTGEFDNARNCNGGPTNALVPIVVGAALGGLVVVVLVAYLIGRLKNRRRSSYQALS